MCLAEFQPLALPEPVLNASWLEGETFLVSNPRGCKCWPKFHVQDAPRVNSAALAGRACCAASLHFSRALLLLIGSPIALGRRPLRRNVHSSTISIRFCVVDAIPSLGPGIQGAVVVSMAFNAGIFLEPVSGYLHHGGRKFRINQQHVHGA